ncbi:MAG: hypothetical protein DCC49_06915 [Acidobacteria bacterium]|nr:MAG: hypothetical protein DCC49_06915 [Acidobacteriota bacterium]
MTEDLSTHTSDTCAFHSDRPAWVRCTRCDRPICGDCVIPASVGQHCPACVRSAQKRIRSIRPDRHAAATFVIIGVTVAAYVLNLILGDRLVEWFLVQPYLVLVENEWWRLVTPVLVHGPIYHILFNMYALFVIGRVLEEGQGTRRFLIVYFVSAISASTASIAVPVFLHPRTTLPIQTDLGWLVPGGSIGASGAVFGLFGALALLLWKRRHQPSARSALTQIVVLILINLAIGFTIGGIDNNAHIGGMIGGIAIAVGFDLADTKSAWQRRSWIGIAVVLAVCAVVLFVARARLLAIA